LRDELPVHIGIEKKNALWILFKAFSLFFTSQSYQIDDRYFLV